MKKLTIRGVLLFAYCIPYGFLLMYNDFNNRSALEYVGIMIVPLILICLCIMTNNIGIGIIGNIITFSISYLCISNVVTERWSLYFKPFFPRDILIFISAILVLVEILLWTFIERGRGN
ncbi:MAG: hypothetical protein N4A64_07850 [Marinisporobacter sp.]|nr:hypothetical protein [Marinisporobacter sp.]